MARKHAASEAEADEPLTAEELRADAVTEVQPVVEVPARVLLSITPAEACDAIEEAVTVGHTHERSWWLDRLAVIRASL